MYRVHCTVYTVHWTVYRVHSTWSILNTVQLTLSYIIINQLHVHFQKTVLITSSQPDKLCQCNTDTKQSRNQNTTGSQSISHSLTLHRNDYRI